MRKFLLITVFFAFTSLLFSFCSCSKDNEQMITDNNNIAQPDFTNKTLMELKKFNQELESSKENINTRSGLFHFFRRLGNTISSDVCGSIRGIKKGIHIVPGHVVVNLLTVVTETWNSSKKAYQEESQEQAPDEEDVFDGYKVYCRTNIDFEDIDSLQLIDSLVTYNNYTVNTIGDSLYNQILIPSSMTTLKQIGIAHNDILEECYLSIIDNNGQNNLLQWDEPYLEEPDYEENEYLDSEEFEEDYYLTIEKVDSCCDLSGFNYQTYLTLYPFESQNVHQTASLLLYALQNTVTSMTDVISLANGYISIIEANNDFTLEEKIQIYSGLIVAVYSYNLWSNRIDGTLQ